MRQITPDDYQVINNVIHRYWPHMSDTLRTELVSAGHLGLTRAAERYDPDHPSGIDFHNYSWTYVRRAMQDALRDHDHLSRSDRLMVHQGETVRRDGSPILDEPPAALNIAVWATFPDTRNEYAVVDDAHLVRWALAQLSARDRFVVGCVDIAGWALTDVAGALGVSESRVSQIRAKAYKRMCALVEDSMSIEEAA